MKTIYIYIYHVVYIYIYHVVQDSLDFFLPMDLLLCSLSLLSTITGNSARMVDALLQVIEDVFVHLHVDVGRARPIKEDPHQLLC